MWNAFSGVLFWTGIKTDTGSQISGCIQAHSDLYRSIDHLWLDHSGWMLIPGLSCDLVMLKPLPFIPPTVILWCCLTLSLQQLIESQQVLTLQPWGRSRSKLEEDFHTHKHTHHICPYLNIFWTWQTVIFSTYGLLNLTEEQTSNCTYLIFIQHQTCLSFCFSQSWCGPRIMTRQTKMSDMQLEKSNRVSLKPALVPCMAPLCTTCWHK